VEEKDQKLKYYFLVAEWLVKSAWIKFQALPRFIRILAYLWLAFAVLTSSRSSSHKDRDEDAPTEAVAAARKAVAAAQAAKLRVIANGFEAGPNKGDLAKLGVEVAREFASEAGEKTPGKSPILALRFTAPADQAAEVKVADSTFALLYGRLSIATPGKVGLGQDTLTALDPAGAQALGRASHSEYVIYGGVETKGADRVLTVTVEEVDDATIIWTKSYPVATANPETIAPEAEKAIPKLGDD
jgi:hypothetical protein